MEWAHVLRHVRRMRSERTIGQLRIEVDITLRPATAQDLGPVEWFGLFSEHREIIERTFRDQQKGDALMILAVHQDLPIGQCWIDLAKSKERKTGGLWALRVIPWLQRHGIGRELLAAAELELVRRGYRRAELAVEKGNAEVIPFYSKLGYKRFGERVEETTYRTPEGAVRHMFSDSWVFAKEIGPEPGRGEQWRTPFDRRTALSRISAEELGEGTSF